MFGHFTTLCMKQLKYGSLINYWSGIPKNVILWLLKLGSTFTCDDIIITNSLSEKILGLTIDNNLDFSDQNQKLTAVFRVSPNINSYKFSLLINSFKPACSVIEKAWRMSMKYKKLFTFNDKSLRIKLWGASQFY